MSDSVKFPSPKTVKFDLIHAVSAKWIGIGLSVALSVLLARGMDVQERGLLAVNVAMAFTFGQVLNFGQPYSVVYLIRTKSSSIKEVMGGSLVLMALAIFCALVLSVLAYAEKIVWLYALALLCSNMAKTLVSAAGKNHYTAWSDVAFSVCVLGYVAYSIYEGHSISAKTYVVMETVCLTLVWVLMVKTLRGISPGAMHATKGSVSMSVKALKDMLKVGMKSYVATFAFVGYYKFDYFYLSHKGEHAAAGLVATGFAFNEFAALLSGTVGAVALLHLSSANENRNAFLSLCKKFMLGGGILALAAFIFVFLLGEALIPFAFGVKYAEAGKLAASSSFLIVLSFAGSMLSAAISALSHSYYVSLAAGLATLVKGAWMILLFESTGLAAIAHSSIAGYSMFVACLVLILHAMVKSNLRKNVASGV